jgi:hypothetical protein
MSLEPHICPHCKHMHVMAIVRDRYYTCIACNKVFIEYDAKPATPEDIIEAAETMSPILIGSKGKVNSEVYTITGCVTLLQNRTTVNLYSVLWINGKEGFLIECDGEYSLITVIDENPGRNLKETKAGKEIDINDIGSAYCYSIDRTVYISLKGEGKLAFDKFTNSIFCSYYSKNKNAAFCFFAKDKMLLLLGKFYTFNELNLSPTRLINDWCK